MIVGLSCTQLKLNARIASAFVEPLKSWRWRRNIFTAHRELGSFRAKR